MTENKLPRKIFGRAIYGVGRGRYYFSGSSVMFDVLMAVIITVFVWSLSACTCRGRYKTFRRNILSPSSGPRIVVVYEPT
jgi:hypothetical protein